MISTQPIAADFELASSDKAQSVCLSQPLNRSERKRRQKREYSVVTGVVVTNVWAKESFIRADLYSRLKERILSNLDPELKKKFYIVKIKKSFFL